MAAHASKRRKLDHVSSEDEDVQDSASFASFGDDDAPGEQPDDEDMDELDGVDDAESDGVSEDEGEDGTTVVTHTPANGMKQDGARENPDSNPGNRLGKPATTPTNSGVARSTSYAAGTFKSSLFKLQVDELLDQIRPKHGKRETEAEAALHQIKRAIESMQEREALPVVDAERELRRSSGIEIPFPDPRPPAAAKYKLAFAKPTGINVVGSYALKTASRAKKPIEIDMVVVMPSSLFQEKDYLNHRYFYKRAYYVACLAAALKTSGFEGFQVRFRCMHENPLLPVITLKSRRDVDSGAITGKPGWQINVSPCVSDGIFNPDKLMPNRNCVRQQEVEGTDSYVAGTAVPTPFYNSSLRADMAVTPYLRSLSHTAKTCEAFRDACLLGTTWAQQRGFSSNISSGGFGGFELSALMSLLLQGGGPGGRPILSDRYSSYQLLKATLQVLAMKDLTKQSLAVGGDQIQPPAFNTNGPVVWDAYRTHNILYKMTSWSYKRLRYEARITLEMLADSTFDAFDSTFIHRKDSPLYSYDIIIAINNDLLRSSELRSSHEILQVHQKLYESLQRGLGDRSRQIHVLPPKHVSWDVVVEDRSLAKHQGDQEVLVGIVSNPETAARLVDHGPSAEQKSQAAHFREFWGDKAELRRFKDGSIQETLVWDSNRDDRSVIEQIARYVLRRHVSTAAEQGAKFLGTACNKILHTTTSSTFDVTMAAFKQLEADIRGLPDLPLSVRQISPADPQLRYTSTESKPGPAEIVMQFEGSARWPDDLVAIQRTKLAFLLKLREQLHESGRGLSARVGLENESEDILNQSSLDIVYDSGSAFRVRIHHDREQALLERMLRDKNLVPSVRDTAMYSLSKYKRDYLVTPRHTQAFAGLCSRHPALSGTVRLIKQWFASHLLSNHVSEEVIELIVARSFVQPWPWQAPSSIQTGFYRTLNWLSRWDWRSEPLIVDLSGGSDVKDQQLQSIRTNFEAWRKLDPALNRTVLFAASNIDSSGSTWTDGNPQKVVASHMTALAKAARTEIEEKQLALEPQSLFTSYLGDFDFVIHLDPVVLGTKRRRKSSNKGISFKNLELDLDDDISTAGFNPVSEFTNELERIFGSAILFFSGLQERPCIAALWNPQTATRPWTLNLSYSTMPTDQAGAEKVQAQINKDGILAEISALGGEMIRKIDMHR